MGGINNCNSGNTNLTLLIIGAKQSVNPLKKQLFEINISFTILNLSLTMRNTFAKINTKNETSKKNNKILQNNLHFFCLFSLVE